MPGAGGAPPWAAGDGDLWICHGDTSAGILCSRRASGRGAGASWRFVARLTASLSATCATVRSGALTPTSPTARNASRRGTRAGPGPQRTPIGVP
jgi:hypothetical protein